MDVTKGKIDPPVIQPDTSWRKSSYSGDTGSCLEVAPVGATHVALRDSKDPKLRPLVFNSTQWADFLARVSAGVL